MTSTVLFRVTTSTVPTSRDLRDKATMATMLKDLERKLFRKRKHPRSDIVEAANKALVNQRMKRHAGAAVRTFSPSGQSRVDSARQAMVGASTEIDNQEASQLNNEKLDFNNKNQGLAI